MNAIHEVAAITAKGQITLPKAIRQALGVDVGGKVAFDFLGDKVVVSRAPTAHEDPAIAGFLQMLEQDIQSGRHISSLPDDLARALVAAAAQSVDLDADIAGDVDL